MEAQIARAETSPEINPLPAKLSLFGVQKQYGNGKRGAAPLVVLAPLDLKIRAGEFLVIVGPSGCGKSTLLALIAGLDRPTAGEILVDGRPISGPGRDRMVIFQEHALFPWLTVLENVRFGLRYKQGLNAAEQRERALHYLELVDLLGFEHSYVHELSGGMRQRAALARALALDPPVLLMDEPFGSLDAMTREQLYDKLQAIFTYTSKTIVFVSHNVREAACLGDRVAVLTGRPARIQRMIEIPLPRPRDFYDPEVSRIAGGILHELRAPRAEETPDAQS